MRSLKELWRISKPLYLDLILAELVTRRVRRNIERVVKSAKYSALFNKILLTAFLLSMGIYSANSLVDISAFYLTLLFIITFFFLHTMTTFVSRGFEILYTLPLEEREISVVRLMTLFRVFDIPVLAVTVAFPIAVAWYNGIKSLLPALICVVSVEVIGLWLSLRFARFFYTRIIHSPGSILSTVLRVISYLIWGIIITWIYGIASIISVLSKMKRLEGIVMTFKFLFPFNFALVTTGHFEPIAVVTSIPVIALSYFAFRDSVDMALKVARVKTVESVRYRVKRSNVIAAFIKKDFRLVTRNPGLVLIIMLPPFEVLLFRFTVKSWLYTTLMLMVFLPMIPFILVGVENYDLLKMLPVRRRDVILSKTLFGCFIYVISAAFITNVIPFLMLPAAFAMLTIACTMAEELGATKNIYANLGSALLVILVSYLLALIPLASVIAAKILGANQYLAAMIPSLAEFAIALIVLTAVGRSQVS